MSRIYISSSWKNPRQPYLVEELRKRGHKVYDFRHPSGRNDSNVWESVSKKLGFEDKYHNGSLSAEEYRNMLLDDDSISRFKEHFDAMNDADTCILLLPCGRSSHIEAGYMAGAGKRVFVMDLDQEVTPELMYLALDDYFYDFDELFKAVDEPIPGVCRVCGCTQENPCYHPIHGNCWWVEPSLCSHCAAKWPNGHLTEHCINDKSNAFK